MLENCHLSVIFFVCFLIGAREFIFVFLSLALKIFAINFHLYGYDKIVSDTQ